MKEAKQSRNLLTMVIKYPVLFATLLIVGASIAGAYLYTAESKYQSSVVIEKGQSGHQAIAQINMPWAEKSAITEKIQSAAFLTEAIKNKETLQHSYYIRTDYKKEQTRYRFPYEVKHRSIGNPDFNTQHYKIEQVNEKIYKLTAEYNGIRRVVQGEFGKEMVENNIALTITPKETKSSQTKYYIQAPEYYFSVESPASMASRILETNKGIVAEEQNGVVTITTTDGHPDKAKELAEVVSSHLLGTANPTIGEHSQTTSPTAEIDEKIEAVSKSLSQTEMQIAEYKKANRITDINIDTETSMAVLKELQLQKTHLEMRLSTLDNLSNYLRKNIDGNNAQVEYGTIEDPEFIAQITRLNEIYKDNGATASTSKEVQLLKASIAERILNTRKKTTIQLEGINMAVNNYQKNLSSIPEQAAALMGLERKLDLDKKVYDLLSEKRAQAIVNGGFIGTTTGRIVRPATLPTGPTSPMWYMVALMSLFSSIAISWVIGFIAETRKATRINVEQAKDNDQRIPFLGTVQLNTGEPAESEEIRSICAKIMMIPHAKTITVTSANQGEGKTSTAIALAQTLAAMDKKVLILDMNMYQPSITNELSVHITNTLADALTGNCDIHDAISITSRPNLEALTAGNMIMGINTWLSSSKREEIVSTLKKHYDYIIIDTPGVSQHIDALPMIKMSDITLFVVKTNSSRKESLHVAEGLKEAHKIENLFCILTPANRVAASRNSRTRDRQINITRKNNPEKPGLLRRIALWFY